MKKPPVQPSAAQEAFSVMGCNSLNHTATSPGITPPVFLIHGNGKHILSPISTAVVNHLFGSGLGVKEQLFTVNINLHPAMGHQGFKPLSADFPGIVAQSSCQHSESRCIVETISLICGKCL